MHSKLWYLAALPAAGLLSVAVTSSGDYGFGKSVADNPAPTLAALVHGDLASVVREQPFMGLTSLLLRAPFVLVASALGGGSLLQYRLGLFACALVAGVVAVAVAGGAKSRGRSRLGAAAVVSMMLLSPLTLGNGISGHPEELLGGALCVAAVLAALHGRPLVAGVLLGLALGTKEWAVLAVVPTLVAARTSRRSLLAIAAGVAAPLAVTLPLADPTAFSRDAHIIDAALGAGPASWWWPFTDVRTLTFHLGGVTTSATPHQLPFGLTRVASSLLILAIAMPIGLLYRRAADRRDPADALGLLALLLLLRCTLDPVPFLYYHVPFVMALIAWEVLTTRGMPVASLLSIIGLWAIFGYLTDDALISSCYAALTVGLAGYISARTLFRPRPDPSGFHQLASEHRTLSAA